MDNSTKQLMSALAQSGAAGVKEVFRAQLEQALNNLLKAELAGFLGYDSYERCGFNSGDSRNGVYTRKFAAAYGSLNLEIPVIGKATLSSRPCLLMLAGLIVSKKPSFSCMLMA